MSREFEIRKVLEQEVTVDGDFSLPFDDSLLVGIVNHNAAKSEEDLDDMDNPKQMIVRITISTCFTD